MNGIRPVTEIEMKQTNGAKSVKLLIMDVDGTLTDGKIYIGNDGEAFKAFNIKDGYGIIDIAPKHGIIPIIITGRKSKIVERRCQELNIKELWQGESDKLACLNKVLKEHGLSLANVAYVGDDVPDISCMRAVKEAGGVVGCPADAIEDVQVISDFVSLKGGGEGAVRDFIDWIISAR